MERVVSQCEGQPEAYRRAIGEAAHQTMVETMNGPVLPLDRFQVIGKHLALGLIYDPMYLGVTRTDDTVFVQITPNAGRPVELMRALYARIAALLAENPGVGRQHVLIHLVEVSGENRSLGKGEAQSAT